jgi:hypothetical protein
MVSEGKGRLFRRKDGKYLIYLPKDLAEDTMFPYKGVDSVFVKVSFKTGENKLIIEKWSEPRFHEAKLAISLFPFLSNLHVNTMMR